MSILIEGNPVAADVMEENRRRELARVEAEKRAAVRAAEANFNNADFVELSSGRYNKKAIVSVRFLDTTIHVRFSSGDIVAVNHEELELLTGITV